MKKLIIGNVLLLLVVGCSNKHKSIPGDHGETSALENKTFFEMVGAVKPYNPNAQDKEKMSICVYAEDEEESCKVADLPLIGIGKEKISIQNILDRTLVSHQFLGDTFKQVLSRMNPEMLQMFGSVTAVVISDRVNPSFFYRVSGAIYLSANYFWRNFDEWKVLVKVKDSREGSSLPLQFLFDHDYIKDGKSIWSRAESDKQSNYEISLSVARLLFHELTHANDYFPASFYKDQTLDREKSYSDISVDRYGLSLLASQRLPTKVKSKKLKQIGQVLFQGEEATLEDRLLTVEDVIQEFKNDFANDSYAYSTGREDLAMLSEEALMLYYYNVPRVVLVIKLPSNDFTPPENFNYPIAWGEKSRVLEPNIKDRAIFAIVNSLGKEISQKVSDRLDQSLPKEIPENTPWEEINKI